jgi:transketolase
MRTAFINELIAQARTNPDLFLVVGDLGFSVVEPFAEEFPDRFLNAGVAEQNMAGMAAGLASEGFRPFIYSIANFPTLRCVEQIRNDICYHQLPVTVVAVGAGLAYGNLGYSHHAVQDIACLRGLPNIDIYSPADPGETRFCLRELLTRSRPAYLRIGKAGEPTLYPQSEDQTLGPLRRVVGQSNARVAVVATGAVLAEALKAAESSADVAVYSLPLVSADSEVLRTLGQHAEVVTVEEHVRSGGIGELVSSVCSGRSRVTLLTVDRNQPYGTGSASHLRAQHGIDASAIRETIQQRAA